MATLTIFCGYRKGTSCWSRRTGLEKFFIVLFVALIVLALTGVGVYFALFHSAGTSKTDVPVEEPKGIIGTAMDKIKGLLPFG